MKPVARDVIAARKPGAALVLHVLQRLREAADPGRTANDPRVQPDREHPWLGCAFLPQPVERVDDVPSEIGAAYEGIAVKETHVVGIERIRHYQLPPTHHLDIIRPTY